MKILTIFLIVFLVSISFVYAESFLSDSYETMNSANQACVGSAACNTGAAISQPFNLTQALFVGDNISIQIMGDGATSMGGTDAVNFSIVKANITGEPDKIDGKSYAWVSVGQADLQQDDQVFGINYTSVVLIDMPVGMYTIVQIMQDASGGGQFCTSVDRSSVHTPLIDYGMVEHTSGCTPFEISTASDFEDRSMGFRVWGILIAEPDTTPPVLDNAICTSCTAGTNTTPDPTPTINITAIDAENSVEVVRISNASSSFDEMGASRNCTAGSGDEWICTLPVSDTLDFGISTIHFTVSDNQGNNNSVPGFNMSIEVPDETFPTYSNLANNASTVTKINEYINFSIDIADNYALTNITARNNITGEWNEWTVTATGVSFSYSYTNQTNLSGGTYICANFSFADSYNNINNTENTCFTVANSVPVVAAPIVNSSPFNTNKTNETLWCFNQSMTDLDEDTLAFTYLWYNGTNNTGIMTQTISPSLTLKNQNWTCELNVSDGTIEVKINSSLFIDNSAPYFNATIPDIEVYNGFVLSIPAVNVTDVDSDTILYFTNDTIISIIDGVINDTVIPESDAGVYTINITAGDGIINVTQLITYTVIDVTPPTAVIGLNATEVRINDIVNISANFTDGSALSYSWFFNNMSFENSTPFLLSGTSGTDFNLTTINITRGNDVNFTVYVNDTAGNVTVNSVVVTVVNAPPIQPTIIFPTTYGNYSYLNISLNVSSSDSDSDTLTYYHYINGSLNSTSLGNSTFNGTEGDWNYTVRAYDGFNFSINTSVVFSMDITSPTITVSFNITDPFFNDTINASATSNENIHTWFVWNNITGKNVTAPDAFNISIINYTRGTNISYIFCGNDTSGNVGCSEGTFVVDNTPPTTPTIIFPVNNDSYALAIIDLNVSSEDLDSDTITYDYFLNNVSDASITTNHSFTGEGNFNFSVSAYDGYNYSANSSIYFTLDTTFPENNVKDDGGFATDNSTRILGRNITVLNLNISFYDTNLNNTFVNISNATISIFSNSSNATTAYFNYTDQIDITTWGYNNYTVNLVANDKAGNENSTWYQFEIYNTVPPTPVIFRPVAETFNEEQELNITYNITDLYDTDGHTYRHSIYLTGSSIAANILVNQSVTLGMNYVLWNFTNISTGSYEINITVFDTTDYSVINSTVSANFNLLRSSFEEELISEYFPYPATGLSEAEITEANCNYNFPCNVTENITVHNSITVSRLEFIWALPGVPHNNTNISIDFGENGIDCNFTNITSAETASNFSSYECNITNNNEILNHSSLRRFNYPVKHIFYNRSDFNFTLYGGINITYYPYVLNYTETRVLETSLQQFNITFANLTNSTSIAASIIYNETLYDYNTKTNLPGYTNFVYLFHIPIITSSELIYNYTFFFDYNYTYPTKVEKRNSTKFNHAVYQLIVDNCTVNGADTLNVTLKNISSGDYVDVDMEYVFNYWLTGSELLVQNFSGTFNKNNQTYCLYPNWTSTISNALFEYSLEGDSILFDYFLFETNLSNITKQLTLYAQGGTTQVLFTTLDIDSNPIEDAYIHILQYDVATNTYQTTEILKTDSQGQALGNIILGTTFYNFFVYYQGNLVYTEQAVKVIETTRTFTINLAGADWFDDFETTLGVITNLYFNNATNNFVYTWSDPTSDMHFACLKVEETNRTGKFELNTTCVESTSGTILYNIPVLNAGSTYIGTGYLKFDFPMITDVVNWLVSPSSSFFRISPLMGLFIALLFCISMVMIGLPIPSLSLTFLGIGVLITSLLGLWAISIMQVVSIIFLMMIQLYMRKSKQ